MLNFLGKIPMAIGICEQNVFYKVIFNLSNLSIQSSAYDFNIFHFPSGIPMKIATISSQTKVTYV